MDNKRSPGIIVDIDGTISDCSHRRHYVEQEDKNWKAFYDNMGHDIPHQWCINLIRLCQSEYKIILVSGRPEDYFYETLFWLERYKIEFDELFMRPKNDHREDYIIKSEIYDQKIKDKYDIKFVIDDRKQVVDMWRSKNLVCLQCAEGNF